MGHHCSQGRLPDPLRRKTTTMRKPIGFWDLLTRFRERHSIGHRGQTTHGQRGNRRSTQDTRVLQSPICRGQSHRRISPSHRPLCTEQVHSHYKVQDGNGENSTCSHSQGRLDDISRPEGCLLPNTNPPRESPISSVCLEGATIPVSRSMFWPVHCSTSVYEDDGADFSGFTSEGSPSPTLPRRLACASCNKTGIHTINTNASRLVYQPRSGHQLGKICSHTYTDQDLFGDGDSLSSFEGFPDPGTGGQPPTVDCHLSEQPVPPSQGVDGSLGSHGFTDLPHPRRETQNEKFTASSVALLEPTDTERKDPNSLDNRYSHRSPLVDGRNQPLVGPVITASVSRPLPVHGCLLRRLGCLSPPRFDKRNLVPIGENSPYQRSGASSYTSGTTALRRASSRQDCCHLFGQHNSTVVPCQARRNSVITPQPGGSGNSGMDGKEFSHLDHTVCQRLFQRHGRLPQPGDSGNIHRMDTTPGGMPCSVENVGMSNSRSVRHEAQFQAGQFCIAFPRSHGDSNRRLLVQLGSPRRICLSTFSTSQECIEQAPSFKGNIAHPSRPILAPERMVPRPDSSVSRHPTSVTATPRPSTSTSHPSISSSSPRASSSRVETVKRLLRHRGYSRGVAQFLAEARRHSTTVNYQYKWKKYRRWCKLKGHTVSTPSSQKFAEFFLYLHQHCKLSVSAIRGYKAMLNSVFAYKGFNLSDDPVLSDISKACARLAPRTINRTPSWNVDVVLKALTLPPFEPLRLASMRDITKKTLFLVALATARRVSELQALSSNVATQDSDLILYYLPEFIAKTETIMNPTKREFRLRSLSPLIGPEDEERLLCPVRAINFYLLRTAPTPRPRQLFVSVRDRKKPLSKAALSFFLRETIKMAHQSLPEELCPLLKVRAHDIRGIATSLLLWRNKSISSILDAACWKTPSVFADYYLKDFQRKEGDILSLGPFVAAGDVVT